MIGIFGGTFDPPHLGHLVLADEAQNAMNLEQLNWVVAGRAPHKLDWELSPAEDRLTMVAAAIGGVQEFKLSTVDMDRPGPHYTIDMLEVFRQENQDHPLALIVGSDSLLELNSWRKADKIVDLVERIAVLERPQANLDLEWLENELPGIGKKLEWLAAPRVGVSGLDIRGRAKEGRPFRFMVPPAVFEIIQERHLYR